MLFPYFAHTRQESKGKRHAAKRHSHQPVAREGGSKNRRKFWVKLFSKSFEERRLFEKKAAPKNFYHFLSMGCFQIVFQGLVLSCWLLADVRATRR